MTSSEQLHALFKQAGAGVASKPKPPVLSIDVLGQNMAVRYGSDVSERTRIRLDRELLRAATLVNDHAEKLDLADRHAILAIDSMYITASNKVCIGEDGRTWVVSVDFMDTFPDTAWLASLWGHEGQHYLNRGKYAGSKRWMDEKVAAKRQLAIGRIIGFTQNEIDYLSHWGSRGNQKVLRKHMNECYTLNSTE